MVGELGISILVLNALSTAKRKVRAIVFGGWTPGFLSTAQWLSSWGELTWDGASELTSSAFGSRLSLPPFLPATTSAHN